MAESDILKLADNARKEALANAKGIFNKDPLVSDAEVLFVPTENPVNDAVAASMFEMGDAAPVDDAKIVTTQAESQAFAIEDAEIVSDIVADNAKESIIEKDVDPQEEMLLENLEYARKQFAKTEYTDRTRMNRIRKALNMSLNGNEENPNIESARKPYESALKEYMEYAIEKLQTSGFDEKTLEKKVKELYSFINVNEATEYYNARTEAKMQYLAGDEKGDGQEKSVAEKSWDFARLKTAEISEWYSKEVPTSVKIGLAVAAFVPGASAFALGKRTWGAFMMVAAGSMQLDKGAQFADVFFDKRARNREFKNISQEDGNVDFNRLREVLSEKIDNIDTKLNNKNLRSGVNKFIAFSAALFLGGSVFKGVMDFAEGKEVASTKLVGKILKNVGFGGGASNVAEVVSENGGSPPKASLGNFENFKERNSPSGIGVMKDYVQTAYAQDDPVDMHVPTESANSEIPITDSFESHNAEVGSKLPKIPTTGVFASEAPASHGSNGAVNHLAGTKEALNTHAETESLTIKKGSSIEKTLIDHLKNHGIKDPGAAAHRMWLDYMHDNKADIIKKVGESEYRKMLKDGMVNVKAGTKLILDEHDPLKIKLHDIGGKISHLEGHHGSMTGDHVPTATTKAPTFFNAKEVVTGNGVTTDGVREVVTGNGVTADAVKKIANETLASNEHANILKAQEAIANARSGYDDAVGMLMPPNTVLDTQMEGSRDVMHGASDVMEKNADFIRGTNEYKEYIGKWKNVFNGNEKIMNFVNENKNYSTDTIFADEKAVKIKKILEDSIKSKGGPRYALTPKSNVVFGEGEKFGDWFERSLKKVADYNFKIEK